MSSGLRGSIPSIPASISSTHSSACRRWSTYESSVAKPSTRFQGWPSTSCWTRDATSASAERLEDGPEHVSARPGRKRQQEGSTESRRYGRMGDVTDFLKKYVQLADT